MIVPGADRPLVRIGPLGGPPPGCLALASEPTDDFKPASARRVGVAHGMRHSAREGSAHRVPRPIRAAPLAAHSSVAEPTVIETVLIRLYDAGQVSKSVERVVDFSGGRPTWSAHSRGAAPSTRRWVIVRHEVCRCCPTGQARPTRHHRQGVARLVAAMVAFRRCATSGARGTGAHTRHAPGF